MYEIIHCSPKKLSADTYQQPVTPKIDYHLFRDLQKFNDQLKLNERGLPAIQFCERSCLGRPLIDFRVHEAWSQISEVDHLFPPGHPLRGGEVSFCHII